MANESREKAHLALWPLWVEADKRLREAGLGDGRLEDNTTSVETVGGARVGTLAGRLTVYAQFEKTDGTDEEVEVISPDDMRDLSDSEVRIHWSNNAGQGTNTPPLRNFHVIARELLALF